MAKDFCIIRPGHHGEVHTRETIAAALESLPAGEFKVIVTDIDEDDYGTEGDTVIVPADLAFTYGTLAGELSEFAKPKEPAPERYAPRGREAQDDELARLFNCGPKAKVRP